MYCYHCGQEIEEGTRFCNHCGVRIPVYGAEEAFPEAGGTGTSVIAEIYFKAAELNRTKDQLMLGYCFFNGMYVKQDYEKAFLWWTKAAELGSMEAQNVLGNCYQEGHGVERNLAEAVKWYRRASEQDPSESPNEDSGDIVVQPVSAKEQEAMMDWFTRVVLRGQAEAQYQLAECCFHGTGMEEDHPEAFRWYRQAAEQGYLAAQIKLGHCCRYGDGMEPNLAEAVQ